jgi:hypothetical protein
MSLLLIAISLLILLYFIRVVYAAQVNLAWDANSELDIAGYKVHYGTHRSGYDVSLDVGNWLSCTIGDLREDEIYYFAVTAYDTAGNESGYSNEVISPIPLLDIKANDSDGPLTIAPSDIVAITVSLDPGGYVDQSLDCWLFADTSNGRYSYTPLGRWQAGSHLVTQTPPDILLLKQVYYNLAPFGLGSYKLFLALDSNADGILDATWMDSVVIHVKDKEAMDLF